MEVERSNVDEEKRSSRHHARHGRKEARIFQKCRQTYRSNDAGARKGGGAGRQQGREGRFHYQQPRRIEMRKKKGEENDGEPHSTAGHLSVMNASNEHAQFYSILQVECHCL